MGWNKTTLEALGLSDAQGHPLLPCGTAFHLGKDIIAGNTVPNWGKIADAALVPSPVFAVPYCMCRSFFPGLRRKGNLSKQLHPCFQT